MSQGTIGLGAALNDYLVRHQPPRHPVFGEIEEAAAGLGNATLQIAPEQAHFLAFLARLIGARRTLEIGTFLGSPTTARHALLRFDLTSMAGQFDSIGGNSSKRLRPRVGA